MTSYSGLINPGTQQHDDALHAMICNLAIAEGLHDHPDGSTGSSSPVFQALLAAESDIAELAPDEANHHREELALCWKSIAQSSAFLHQFLAGFRRHLSTLIDNLVTLDHGSSQLCADLLERTRSRCSPTPINVSPVSPAWVRLYAIDGRYHLYHIILSLHDSAEETRALALNHAWGIEWMLGAIDLLSKSYAVVEHARARLTPALRFNQDILAVIFELVAEVEAPTRRSLGWVRLGHVCSSWRQVLLRLPGLWARDAYIFGAVVATSDMLARAHDGLVSVSAIRLPESADEKLRLGIDHAVTLHREKDLESIWLSACKGTLRDLNIWAEDRWDNPPGNDLSRTELVRILCDGVRPQLRSVYMVTRHNPTRQASEELRPMASHPNLRHLTLVNLFIPFTLPNLVSLELSCNMISPMPQPWLDAFLDALESSPALTVLRVHNWVLPPLTRSRVIELPRLETLCCTDARVFEVLHAPALQCTNAVIDRGDDDEYMLTALRAVFERYRLPLRSMHISQRARGPASRAGFLIMRFGRSPSHCPPAPPASFDDSAESLTCLEEGPFISFVFGDVVREEVRSALSVLFSVAVELIRETPGTEALETIGFDNETREHTFPEGLLDQNAFSPMRLPSLPSVQTIELPMRDCHTTFHLLYSLYRGQDTLNLPLLSCLRFNGPLSEARHFGPSHGIHTILSWLLRARASSTGVARITSLEFDLDADTTISESFRPSGGPGGVETLKWTVINAVKTGLGDGASVKIVHETISDPKEKFTANHIRASITYLV